MIRSYLPSDSNQVFGGDNSQYGVTGADAPTVG